MSASLRLLRVLDVHSAYVSVPVSARASHPRAYPRPQQKSDEKCGLVPGGAFVWRCGLEAGNEVFQ